jgi:hypothetical protein
MLWEDLSIPSSWTAWPLKMGSIGCPETLVTTNPRSVTSQKSDDLIYTVPEAWYHTVVASLGSNCACQMYVSSLNCLLLILRHILCVCVRVLKNKLYTHIHKVPHTYTELITIVGTVCRRVRIVNRLMSALGGKNFRYSSVHCKSHMD